jgi:hypothetical protein
VPPQDDDQTRFIPRQRGWEDPHPAWEQRPARPDWGYSLTEEFFAGTTAIRDAVNDIPPYGSNSASPVGQEGPGTLGSEIPPKPRYQYGGPVTRPVPRVIPPAQSTQQRIPVPTPRPAPREKKQKTYGSKSYVVTRREIGWAIFALCSSVVVAVAASGLLLVRIVEGLATCQ